MIIDKITVGEIIQTMALLFAGVGLILNVISMRKATKQIRVNKIMDLEQNLFNDKELQEKYYEIEYDKLEIENISAQSSSEKTLDRLLLLFDSIAMLYKARIITKEELNIVGYNYMVIYQNLAVQKYLKYLDKWFIDRKINGVPFKEFREIGKEIEKKMVPRK